jgi:hypothetical protein
VKVRIALTVSRIAFRQSLVFVATDLKGNQLHADRMLRTLELAGNLFDCHAAIPTITQLVLFIDFPCGPMFCRKLHDAVSMRYY